VRLLPTDTYFLIVFDPSDGTGPFGAESVQPSNASTASEAAIIKNFIIDFIIAP
jgi:hypothetical protein